MCAFMGTNGCYSNIQSTQVRSWLNAVVNLIGEDILGSTVDDIGLHSIRSEGALEIFCQRLQ